jgi:hypothetical protein
MSTNKKMQWVFCFEMKPHQMRLGTREKTGSDEKYVLRPY